VLKKKEEEEGEMERGMLYVLNSLIVPVDFQKYPTCTVKFTKITPEAARDLLLKSDFISAVGHEATAKVLSQILNLDIHLNRIAIKMELHDSAIHFVLRTRLPEGVVLSEEELKQLDFDLVLSTVLQD
jgi:hypothetical protein